MLLNATSKAAFTSGDSTGSGRSCVVLFQHSAQSESGGAGLRTATRSTSLSSLTPSNFSVYSATAASPRSRTASTMGRTWRGEVYRCQPEAAVRQRGAHGRAVSRIVLRSTRGRASSALASCAESLSSW